MICPNCGNNTEENFCSFCGSDLRQIQPPQSASRPIPNPTPNYPPQTPNQTYPQYPPQQVYQGPPVRPPEKPEWYKDGSIRGLISLGLGLVFVWETSFIVGVIFTIIALILGIKSKKSKGRIPAVTIILSIIALVIELIMGFLLLLTLSVIGTIF